MKKYFKKIASFICAISLGACTSAGFAIANYPVDKSALTISTDIAYGNKTAQKLDIYKAKDAGKNLPVIVFFYGGGYSDGSKDAYPFLAEHFTKQGYIVAIPDYSKYPDVKFPAFVEDGAKAINWVAENIGEYGGNDDKIIVIGHSAGAHIAALLNYDESYGAQDKIKAFVGLAGPYHFKPVAEKYKKIFGPPENYKNMYVDNFVDGNEPPALLLWGTDDDLVGKQNIDILTQAVEEKSGKIQSVTLPDISHISIISAFTEILNKEKVTKIVDEYLAGLKN
jgi:acetyl esterase/lipase